jgi:hypothetical protein
MWLLGDQDAQAGFLMKLIEEWIRARSQRRDDDEGCRARSQHLLLAQLKAFELNRLSAFIDDLEFDSATGWYTHFLRLELTVFCRDPKGQQLVGLGVPSGKQGEYQRSQSTVSHVVQYPPFLPTPAKTNS